MAGDDLDPGPGGGMGRQGRGMGCGWRRLAKALQHAVLQQRQRAGIAAPKGVDTPAMLLAQVRRRKHLAAQHRQHAWHRAAARQCHGIEQVLRAVGLQGRGRPHGCSQQHRLERLQHAVQKVSRLFERVGAVRDDQAAHVGPLQVPLHGSGQRQPQRQRHVLAVQLGQLLAFDWPAGQQRHCRDQGVDAQGGGTVADAVGGAVGRAGNRAAGAQDHHLALGTCLWCIHG